jgi:hypothetical protein
VGVPVCARVPSMDGFPGFLLQKGLGFSGSQSFYEKRRVWYGWIPRVSATEEGVGFFRIPEFLREEKGLVWLDSQGFYYRREFRYCWITVFLQEEKGFFYRIGIRFCWIPEFLREENGLVWLDSQGF